MLFGIWGLDYCIDRRYGLMNCCKNFTQLYHWCLSCRLGQETQCVPGFCVVKHVDQSLSGRQRCTHDYSGPRCTKVIMISSYDCSTSLTYRIWDRLPSPVYLGISQLSQRYHEKNTNIRRRCQASMYWASPRLYEGHRCWPRSCETASSSQSTTLRSNRAESSTL